MAWVKTIPTLEEQTLIPQIGSHWINRKTERRINAGKSTARDKASLEIIVTAIEWRDNECENSLQISYCLASDPASSDIFMAPLASFYDKYRAKG